ncbi:MAG TPA: SDR family oxidoreductase [Solirubrobacterales bacterium]|jgi:NAD(P)-dependent dehydrogenase (short-subunit alcohol dehydrogenase family)
MLLDDKVAVVYGAGSIGGAVARAFGAEGARVFVGDRTAAKAEALAAEVEAAGGSARGLEVDALDEASVRRFVDSVAGEAGRLDVSFNLVSVDDVQGTPLVEMEWANFMRPIETAVRSNFLTVKAAVPHMVRGGGGAILFFGGSGDPVPNYSIGGFQIALHAVEAMRRQYASELGAAGVRFVTLRTGGVPDTIPDDDRRDRERQRRSADRLGGLAWWDPRHHRDRPDDRLELLGRADRPADRVDRVRRVRARQVVLTRPVKACRVRTANAGRSPGGARPRRGSIAR